MSLLNDALRAAEQRQQKPEAPAAYTGQSYAAPVRRNRLVPVLVVMVVVLAAVAGYALLAGNPQPPTAVQAEPEESTPLVTEQQQNIATESAVDPEPEKPVTNPLPESPADDAPEVKEPEPVVALASETQSQALSENEPEPAPVPEAAPEKQVAQTTPPEPTEPASNREPRVEPESESEPAQVKEVRETPETIDRRVSRELASLLRQGRFREAGDRLRALLADQQAPVSRATMARALLVEGQPEIALAWLPASEVMPVPELRLLRARGLLDTGDLDGALSVLRSQVPPLQGHIEYRVTLATLLQQAGENGDAAEQWTALLTTDDSRAAWWVGLGVALESQGKSASAKRAYTQAASLPGLSSSLADYVRERLKQLQAG